MNRSSYSSGLLGTWVLLALVVGAGYADVPPGYNPVDVGANNVSPDVNNSGAVVGSYWDDGAGGIRGYMWENGVTTVIEPDNPARWAVAQKLNDTGTVVGYGVAGGEPAQAFLWEGGSYTEIGPSPEGWGWDVNNSGLVAGEIWNGGTPSQPALYDPGTGWTNLGTFGGPFGQAFALNEASQVVGWADDFSGDRRPFMWSSATGMVDMLTGPELWGEAHDINDNGIAVGFWRLSDELPEDNKAFLWDIDNGKVDLGLLPGASYSEARGINNLGQIVGHSGNRAFLYDSGMLYDLNDFLPPDSGWVLNGATAINESGWIVGVGVHNGVGRAFLLTPVPEPATLTLVVLGGLFLRRLRD